MDVFAELFFLFFSYLIDLAVVHHQIAVVVSCLCLLIVSATAAHAFLFVSLTMEALLEVGKVFVDLHGRSKSRVKCIYYVPSVFYERYITIILGSTAAESIKPNKHQRVYYFCPLTSKASLSDNVI